MTALLSVIALLVIGLCLWPVLQMAAAVLLALGSTPLGVILVLVILAVYVAVSSSSEKSQ